MSQRYAGHARGGERLHKMQAAAWKASRGRPRSAVTRKRISDARLASKRAAGVPFCEELGRPIFFQDGYWCVFLDGKKVRRGKALYERKNRPIPKGWIIHHIDGDKENDDLANLVPLSRATHYRLHLYWSAINHWLGVSVPGTEILAKFKHWSRYG